MLSYLKPTAVKLIVDIKVYLILDTMSSAEHGSGFISSSSGEQVIGKPIEKMKIWPKVTQRWRDLNAGLQEDEEY